MITVDYVTEPGYLQGHELITRLTDNNGNYSFDAQVRLDFAALDSAGNLIWNPTDLYYDVSQTGRPRDHDGGERLICGVPDDGDYTKTEFTGFGGLLPAKAIMTQSSSALWAAMTR